MSLDRAQMAKAIEEIWERRTTLSPNTEDAKTVLEVLHALDAGDLRVANPLGDGEWAVNTWVKQAVLLGFRAQPQVTGSMGGASFSDKYPLKTAGWEHGDFELAGFRMAPGALVRFTAHIAKDAVLMPSFVNVGAHVGASTMIDTWATVGSCAQIGARCHISGGTGIGGVLEPLQAQPVIIEDDVFIGARSEVAEGVRVGEGAVIAMGVFLGASTPIVDRETGETVRGHVPAGSVVVPGTRPPRSEHEPALACAVIVKRVDAATRERVGANALLREAADQT
jgi:2,3,4,5-tetrahydropyridine-2-carboxylate N-succinyltransferase